jgi:predicted anti-sigma-YlaC factor YlaD
VRHERFKHLLLRVVDGVATERERAEFMNHIRSCEECRREYGEFRNLEEFMSAIKLKDLSEDARAAYARLLYNRLERGLGWILLSLGVILLLGFGGFTLIKEFIINSTVSVILKIGVCAVLAGLIVLLVSVLKERLFVRKYDKYSKEVKL